MTELIESGRGGAVGESAELTHVQQWLAEVKAGGGSVLYVEGVSGSGKTGLLNKAAEAAGAVGMRTLDARAHPLEREFPFGVALQLFEDAWYAVAEDVRRALLEGPARAAGELMSGALRAQPGLAHEWAFAVIRGLFWLTRALAADGSRSIPGQPLALMVDDVDCADATSLGFLAYIASRIGKLPIAVVVAACPTDATAESPALRALRSSAELLLLAPPEYLPNAEQSALSVPALGWPPLDNPAEGPRVAAAQLALRKSLAEGHRESVIDLAELAWGGGTLLDSDEDVGAWAAVARSLQFVDELERAVEISQAAGRTGPPVHPPGADHCCEGWSLFHQGRITAALSFAEARAAHRDDLAARGLIAACRLAQGRLDEAEVALAILGDGTDLKEPDVAVLLDVRAQLRLAQLRPADALADALDAGRRARDGSPRVVSPGVVAWRSTAAFARAALGERDRARALAEEELALARERGLGRVVIRDLRVLAFAAKGTRSLDLLSEAVRVGRAAPPRLEYVGALVDLGAATRRANQRTAARNPLRRGLELAERGGAAALARRAREELDATGARSRKVMLSGIPALTPSERRVADLAAGGLTTRQISEVLFVTPKTVEFHLRHIYRKLDIPSSRAELTRVLSRAASG